MWECVYAYNQVRTYVSLENVTLVIASTNACDYTHKSTNSIFFFLTTWMEVWFLHENSQPLKCFFFFDDPLSHLFTSLSTERKLSHRSRICAQMWWIKPCSDFAWPYLNHKSFWDGSCSLCAFSCGLKGQFWRLTIPFPLKLSKKMCYQSYVLYIENNIDTLLLTIAYPLWVC